MPLGRQERERMYRRWMEFKLNLRKSEKGIWGRKVDVLERENSRLYTRQRKHIDKNKE